MTQFRSLSTDEEREALLDATLAVLKFHVLPAWRLSALAHLKVSEEQALLVLAFPLEDEIEPAPVYRL